MSENDDWTDLASTENNFRRPKTGDRLFRESDNWDRTVIFSGQRISRFVHIWSGFADAAEILARRCEDDPVGRDLLIFPILFLYRHGLEMALKWIILTYGNQRKMPDDHNLWNLWKACRIVIEENGSDDHDGTFEAVEQIVKDFHDIDKHNIAFRYPTNKNGKLVDLRAEPFDLENLKNVMKGVDNFFIGVDGELDERKKAIGWGEQ